MYLLVRFVGSEARPSAAWTQGGDSVWSHVKAGLRSLGPYFGQLSEKSKDKVRSSASTTDRINTSSIRTSSTADHVILLVNLWSGPELDFSYTLAEHRARLMRAHASWPPWPYDHGDFVCTVDSNRKFLAMKFQPSQARKVSGLEL